MDNNQLEKVKREYQCELINGIWKREGWSIILDANIQRKVLKECHDHPTAGHPGAASTYFLTRRNYWWPNLKDFVRNYVKGCGICQQNKTITQPQKPPLFPITPKKDTRPFATIAMDWITKLPISDGWDSILTITDHDCSKAVLFIPCKETMGTDKLAKEYFQKVFPHFGIPDKIILDRDPRLTSELTKAICREGNIQQNISTTYHPQTDGQSEWTNQMLETFLRIFCSHQ